MPCYTVNTLSVEFRADNRPILDAALKSLGIVPDRADTTQMVLPGNIWLDLAAGRATFPSRSTDTVNAIRRAYALEAVKRAAIANRWSVRPTSGTAGMVVKF